MMKRNPILVMLAVLFVAFGAAGEEKETVKVKSGALLEVWQLPKNYRWGTRPQTPAVGSIVDNGNGWSVKALADSEELASMQSARNLMLKWSGLLAVKKSGEWKFSIVGPTRGNYSILLLVDGKELAKIVFEKRGQEFTAIGKIQLKPGYHPISVYAAGKIGRLIAPSILVFEPGESQSRPLTPGELFHR
ncbi:hypothetical protein C5Q97_02470 [Victivallales bacterium CCUG 44730]|nr:hypothetical protein C5Q97_02470 [Victivallales bacterium CCUG 44730]